MKKLIKFFASGFYVGYLPYAPGTFGTLLALFIYVILPTSPNFWWLLILCMVIGGTIISQLAEEIYDEIDCPKIVIDEITGFFIAMAFLPKTLSLIVLGFIIFRFIDITKIYPMNKFQAIKGGLGIMLDDIYAGILTNLILHVIHKI